MIGGEATFSTLEALLLFAWHYPEGAGKGVRVEAYCTHSHAFQSPSALLDCISFRSICGTASTNVPGNLTRMLLKFEVRLTHHLNHLLVQMSWHADAQTAEWPEIVS